MASVFLRFSGLMLSSLADFGIPFGMVSGLLSDDCDKFRAFCAEPSMPSRLKFGVRAAAAALSEFGDFSRFPLEPAASWGEGISTVKSPRFGSGNCLTTLALADVVMVAVAEWGESPFEDGDMLGVALACSRLRPDCGFPKARAAERRAGADSSLGSLPSNIQSAAADCSSTDRRRIQTPQAPKTLELVVRCRTRIIGPLPTGPECGWVTGAARLVRGGWLRQVGRMVGKGGKPLRGLGDRKWRIHMYLVPPAHTGSACAETGSGTPIKGGRRERYLRTAHVFRTMQYHLPPRGHL